MTELSFAKTFLTTLDSKPIKLQADHAADPKTFEPKGAVSVPQPPMTNSYLWTSSLILPSFIVHPSAHLSTHAPPRCLNIHAFCS